MIVTLKPKGEVEDAEKLECLTEALRAVTWNTVKSLCDILAAHTSCLIPVAVGECDNVIYSALTVLIGILA